MMNEVGLNKSQINKRTQKLALAINSESIGSLAGVMGALLVALGPSFIFYGYLSWCLSNMMLVQHDAYTFCIKSRSSVSN